MKLCVCVEYNSCIFARIESNRIVNQTVNHTVNQRFCLNLDSPTKSYKFCMNNELNHESCDFDYYAQSNLPQILSKETQLICTEL